MIQLWNSLKTTWSRFNDWLMWAQPRAPLPEFLSVDEFAQYLFARFTYRADPLNGAADFFTHPERFQWALLNPDKSSGVARDCDDLATYAFACLKKIHGVSPSIYTLYDNSGKFGHHVVCTFTAPGGVRGVIDTNGLKYLTDTSTRALCRHFTSVYASLGYTFTEAVYTEYPF